MVNKRWEIQEVHSQKSVGSFGQSHCLKARMCACVFVCMRACVCKGHLVRNQWFIYSKHSSGLGSTAGNTYWTWTLTFLDVNQSESFIYLFICLISDNCTVLLLVHIIIPKPVFHLSSLNLIQIYNSRSRRVTSFSSMLDRKLTIGRRKIGGPMRPKLVPFTPRCYSVCSVHTTTESYIEPQWRTSSSRNTIQWIFSSSRDPEVLPWLDL